MKSNKIEKWNDSYENLATTYSERIDTPSDLVNTIQYQFVQEDIQRYLKPAQRAIVECGCGGARTSLFLAKRGYDVTCTDNSPEALRLARDNFAAENTSGQFVEDDLLNSKLAPNSFDCAMSFGLLEHFEDLRPILASITNMIKPGGIQIHCIIPKKFSAQVLVNLGLFPARFANNLRRGRLKGIVTTSYRDFPHYENSYSARQYCDEFKRAGNDILRCEAGGTLYPVLTLPLVGPALVKAFDRHLYQLIRKLDRTEAKLAHIIAPTFYIVCRKRA